MQVILKYFPQLSDIQKKQFHQLKNLYEFWNRRVNVISRKDIQHLYTHHVLHSLSITKVMEFAAGNSVLDIGTGGGFPGIPLAIFFPESNFHLVDSIAKKIRVVDDIVEQLGLENVTSQRNRAEDVEGQFDFVVSRGVTNTMDLYSWSKKLIKQRATSKGGRLVVLKGGNIESELKPLAQRAMIYPISKMYKESFFEDKFVVEVVV